MKRISKSKVFNYHQEIISSLIIASLIIIIMIVIQLSRFSFLSQFLYIKNYSALIIRLLYVVCVIGELICLSNVIRCFLSLKEIVSKGNGQVAIINDIQDCDMYMKVNYSFDFNGIKNIHTVNIPKHSASKSIYIKGDEVTIYVLKKGDKIKSTVDLFVEQ